MSSQYVSSECRLFWVHDPEFHSCDDALFRVQDWRKKREKREKEKRRDRERGKKGIEEMGGVEDTQ